MRGSDEDDLSLAKSGYWSSSGFP